MTEKEIIKIKTDNRYHRISSAYAIGDIYDALVEIITNCEDSYHRLQNCGGDISIEIQARRGNKPSSVIVKDRAEGMTDTGMKEKLGRIGKRTSAKNNRGFMARGLRDCLTLGDIKVESIVNGRYYACKMSSKEEITLEPLEKCKANASHRKTMGVRKNGTMITLEYDSSVPLPRFETLVERLPYHYALRDILSQNSKSKIRVLSGGKQKVLSIPEVPGTKVCDKNFEIDGYPGANARLQIWKSEVGLDDIAPPRMRKSGILVVSQQTIHQSTMLKFENNAAASFYYGRCDCNYIQQLLEEYDEHPGGQRPSSNPSILIDPNRQTGLTMRHPFAKKLFENINRELKELIDKDNAKAERHRGDISNKEMRKRLNDLAQFASTFRDQFVDEFQEDEKDVIDATLKEGILILPPKLKVGVGEVRSLTVYVRNDMYNSKRKTRVHSTKADIVGLEKTFSNDSLSPHPRYPDIFYGSFRVKGVAEGTAQIIVHPSKKSKAVADVEVVKQRNKDEPDLLHPLEFDKKAYTIPEGKSKIVQIWADMKEVSEVDLVARVICPADKNNALSISNGGQCNLSVSLGALHAKGEIRITGRSVTKRALEIEAYLGDFSANATVRIEERKSPKSKLDFKIVESDLAGFRETWDISNPDTLLISGIHPSIARYFGSPDDDFPGQNEVVSRALLAEIITDSVCLRVLQDETRSKPGDFQFEGLGGNEILDSLSTNLRKKINQFIAKAHKILVNDI